MYAERELAFELINLMNGLNAAPCEGIADVAML